MEMNKLRINVALKVAIVLTVVMMASAVSQAQIAYEDFAPAAGKGAGTEVTDNNSWNNNLASTNVWEGYGAGVPSDRAQLYAGDLSYAGLDTTEDGFCAYLDGSQPTSTTSTRMEFTLTESGPLYASFLLKVTDLTGTATEFQRAASILGLGQIEGDNLVGIRADGSGGYVLGFAKNEGDIQAGTTVSHGQYTTGSLTLGQTYLVVMGTETAGVTDSDGANTAKVWINPASLGGAAPAESGTWAWYKRAGQLSTFSVGDGDDGVNDGTSAVPTTYIDDLRIGTSYADVTPVSGAPVTDYEWGVDATGSWDDASNWSGGSGVPSDSAKTAIFGSAITAARTVTTDTTVTVKAIEFDNANQYVIAGAGSVNLEADSGDASIDVVSGDHQFQAVVNLASNTDVAIAASSSLAMNNALNLAGNTLTKSGAGTLSINNDLTTAGGSVVMTAGTLGGVGTVGGDVTNTSGAVAPGNSAGMLAISGNFDQAAGGTLEIQLESDSVFDVLAVTGSAALGGDLDVTLLGVYTPTGGTQFTIMTASSITGTFASMTGGYSLNNTGTALVLTVGAGVPGDTDGDGDVDADDIDTLYANLGDNSYDQDGDGDADTDDVAFLVQTTLGTEFGDANLDKAIDGGDLARLGAKWLQSGFGWADGNFNGDGAIDGGDLSLMGAKWLWTAPAGAVPEPATLGLLAMGALALLKRTRKS